MKKNIFTKVSKKFFLGSLLVVLFFSSMYGVRCFMFSVCEIPLLEKFVRHDMLVLMPKGAIHVEVANTVASRTLGLSFRESLGENEGMLFVFDAPGRYGFWMKDMNFPLDILWINQNGIVVDIERNVQPSNEASPKVYINSVNASYVLEIPAGGSDKRGVYIGSKIRFEP